MKQQTQKQQVNVEAEEGVALFQTSQDLRTAILVVSVLANVTLFVVWLTLMFTSRYDAAIAGWLLGN